MNKIKIKEINPKMIDFYILVDTAFSHMGDLDYIKKQINATVIGRANGIKFQILLDKDDAYSPNYDVYESFSNWMFSEEKWKEILSYTKDMGELDIIALPIDSRALTFCHENTQFIDAVEIHSINFNQRPFLENVGNISSVIILGIGGRTIKDIDYCLEIIKNTSDEDISYIMMHGFQSFPTNYENINLARINELKERYNGTIGYADHTKFDDNFGENLIEYAYLNGARVFEKHLVIKRGEKRVDYEAAIEKEDLSRIRERLNKLIKIQAEDAPFNFTEAENNYRNREKQLITISDVRKGDVLNINNIGFKVNKYFSDFEQKDYDTLIGKKAAVDIPKNTVLKSHHIVDK